MGWSGLIYAAIVAGWAAVLVPRWVRRNEEAERAKAADAMAGVRVLERRRGPVTAARDHDEGSPRRHVLHAPHPPLPDLPPRLAAASRDERGSARLPVPLPGTTVAAPTPGGAPSHTSPSARRRRVLAVLTAGSVLTVVMVVTGLLAPGWLVGPMLLLSGFVVLARAAVRREAASAQRARVRARTRRQPRGAIPGRAGPAERHATAARTPGRVPDTVSQPADPGVAQEQAHAVDDSWDPVPVPLPTYVTAPRAPRVIRRIDLSAPGAWTSGGELPLAEHPAHPEPPRGGSVFPSLPPVVGVEPATATDAPALADDEPGFEHRPAVGD